MEYVRAMGVTDRQMEMWVKEVSWRGVVEEQGGAVDDGAALSSGRRTPAAAIL